MSGFTEEYNQRHCRLPAGAKPPDTEPSVLLFARRRIMVLHLSATHIKIPVAGVSPTSLRHNVQSRLLAS
ncbi:hypothetical protein VPH35_129540 [Triticum aestivum]